MFLFDAPMDLASRQEEIEAISHKLDCHINVKYKPKMAASSVVVKTFERNIAACYEVRRLLGIEIDPITYIE